MALDLRGRSIVILGCSNGRLATAANQAQVQALVDYLTSTFQAQVTVQATIWRQEGTGNHVSGAVRAAALAQALRDDQVSLILDPTGGDLANECLGALEPDFFQRLDRQTPVLYMGYSDNSVILNACLAHPLIRPVYFYPLALVDDEASCQAFHQWLAGAATHQHYFGGNLRCFLKLAGTPWWPSAIQGRHLLLEASSGSLERIRSLLTQLSQVLDFSTIEDITLGQFNEIDAKGQRPLLVDYLSELTGRSLTENLGVGHQYPLQPVAFQPINDLDRENY